MRTVVGVYSAYEIVYDGTGMSSVAAYVFLLGHFLADVGHHFAEKTGEMVASGLLAICVRRFVYQRHQQLLVQIYLVRRISVDGRDGIVIEVVYDVPRVLVGAKYLVNEILRNGCNVYIATALLASVRNDGTGWQHST